MHDTSPTIDFQNKRCFNILAGADKPRRQWGPARCWGQGQCILCFCPAFKNPCSGPRLGADNCLPKGHCSGQPMFRSPFAAKLAEAMYGASFLFISREPSTCHLFVSQVTDYDSNRDRPFTASYGSVCSLPGTTEVYNLG